jgi:GH24 family phage-related lysozyme (muramidase)
MIEIIIDRIKKHEGFRGNVYNDHLGNPTIGYGTLLPLTKVESELLLEHRLENNLDRFIKLYPKYTTLYNKYQFIIIEMIYQLGASGVFKFKKMLSAMKKSNDKLVIKNMRDSKWYIQTPNRVENIMIEYLE